MNKKNVSKLELFFSGLVMRMEENKDFFIDMSISYKSGTKLFDALVTYHNGFILDYQATKKNITTTELNEHIRLQSPNYEEVIVRYQERGTTIVIEADDRRVCMKYEDSLEKKDKTSVIQTGRDYVVNPSMASELLEEIGILAKNGKIKNDKIRKYNQIDYFVELMQGVIKEIDHGDEIVILDAACGKSYLSFVLNFYLREVLKKKCYFIGVDYSDVVIEGSKKIAKNLGYNNMEFVKSDLGSYMPSRKIDLVISLHACDTATDMAIGLGVRAKSKAIVCVPCCHKDILKQYSYKPFNAVTKHGILKARFADTLTDALRAAYLESVGYKVSMVEYISPLETPKNIMIRSIHTGKMDLKSKMEYDNLKKMLNVNPAIERFACQG